MVMLWENVVEIHEILVQIKHWSSYAKTNKSHQIVPRLRPSGSCAASIERWGGGFDFGCLWAVYGGCRHGVVVGVLIPPSADI